jgi:hypothetical protein
VTEEGRVIGRKKVRLLEHVVHEVAPPSDTALRASSGKR